MSAARSSPSSSASSWPRWSRRSLDEETANHMVENVVGVYGLPLGIGLNFQVNGNDYLVPMCVEEPSVVAAASNAAKMIREGGGFTRRGRRADHDLAGAARQRARHRSPPSSRIEAHAAEIIALADAAYPVADRARRRHPRHRGARRSSADRRTSRGMLAVAPHVDVRDAMGANLVNTIAEAVADRLAELAEAEVGLRILSNLADRRCVRVHCRVPARRAGDRRATRGEDGARRHRRGQPLRRARSLPRRHAQQGHHERRRRRWCIATGNDWRGVEAGAHAFAATRARTAATARWPPGAWPTTVGRSGRPHRDADGRRHRRRHAARAPGRAARAAMILGVERASRARHGHGVRRAWRRTWPRCARWPRKASSAGTCRLHARIAGASASARPASWSIASPAELARLGDVRAEVATQILRALQGRQRVRNPA